MNELDQELRSRFEQLRVADATRAPGFRELVDRARKTPVDTDRRVRRWPRRLAIPIALAATIVLAVGIARVSRRRAFVAPPLSTWISPTAALLHTPGIGVLAPPHLLTSVLDPALSQSVFRKGIKR